MANKIRVVNSINSVQKVPKKYLKDVPYNYQFINNKDVNESFLYPSQKQINNVDSYSAQLPLCMSNDNLSCEIKNEHGMHNQYLVPHDYYEKLLENPQNNDQISDD